MKSWHDSGEPTRDEGAQRKRGRGSDPREGCQCHPVHRDPSIGVLQTASHG
jgi:hypothetical protein